MIFDQNLTINEFDLISNKFIKRFAINQLKTKNIPKKFAKRKNQVITIPKKEINTYFFYLMALLAT
ncbi:hypothetical protein AAX19_02245 [Oenococcus oeni]|nr:hypothetical protein AAX19_02245 [Oenococcus oeni]